MVELRADVAILVELRADVAMLVELRAEAAMLVDLAWDSLSPDFGHFYYKKRLRHKSMPILLTPGTPLDQRLAYYESANVVSCPKVLT